MKKFFGYGSLVILAVVSLLALFYILFPKSAYRLMINGQRRAADLTRREIQVDDHRIVYLEGGKGKTVVLLHGYGLDKDCWAVFAKGLKGYHLVIPDIPGFGESSRVRTDSYDFDSQIKRLDRFMEVLRLDRFHLAGQSMGGALTAVYGAKHPDKVLTLALLDPACVPSRNKSEFYLQLKKGNNLLFADSVKGFDSLMELIFAKPPAIPGQFKKIVVSEMIAHLDFNKKIWRDWKPEEYSVAPILPRINAPVLIMWGDKDKVTDIGGVDFLEKNLKNSRTVIMKDTGHAPMMEKPEEAAKAYLTFLNEKR